VSRSRTNHQLVTTRPGRCNSVVRGQLLADRISWEQCSHLVTRRHISNSLMFILPLHFVWHDW
jgi:hypothetical protein